MERIDEIIDQFERAKCPKDYETCPLRVVGNDCDNFCAFTEASDMLRDYKQKMGSGWIKCSDRLPEKDGTYLAVYRPLYGKNIQVWTADFAIDLQTISSHDFGPCHRSGWYEDISDIFNDCDYAELDVLYWMPFPELPKELKEV